MSDIILIAQAIAKPITDTVWTPLVDRRIPVIGKCILFDCYGDIKTPQEATKATCKNAALIGKIVTFSTKAVLFVEYLRTGKKKGHFLSDAGILIAIVYGKIYPGPSKSCFGDKHSSKTGMIYAKVTFITHHTVFIAAIITVAFQAFPPFKRSLETLGMFAVHTGSAALTIPNWITVIKAPSAIIFMADNAAKSAHEIWKGEASVETRIHHYLKIFSRIGKIVLISAVCLTTVGTIHLSFVSMALLTLGSRYLTIVSGVYVR